MRRELFVAALTLTTLANVSHAAVPNTAAASLVGAWSGEAPGQGGMIHGTDSYSADGNYVSVMQLPNGTVQRIWGRYTVKKVSPSQVSVHYLVQGFLPRQICAQAPGFAVQCRPNSVPPSSELVITFVTPSRIEGNGLVLSRDPSPRLLAMSVPERLILAARAPIAPNMVQPVMPNMPGHYTPTGPGSVQGMKADDNLQQRRICAVNNGQVIRQQDGTLTCIN